MAIDCIYWGIFLSKYGLRSVCDKMDSPALEVEINNPHVTFGFKTPCPEDILGRNAVVEIVGYACDGKNEAFMVNVPGQLARYYEGADIPHVTISVSEDAKPVDSGKLEFEPIDLPEEFLYGKIGYFGYDHRVHFSTPESTDDRSFRIFGKENAMPKNLANDRGLPTVHLDVLSKEYELYRDANGAWHGDAIKYGAWEDISDEEALSVAINHYLEPPRIHVDRKQFKEALRQRKMTVKQLSQRLGYSADRCMRRRYESGWCSIEFAFLVCSTLHETIAGVFGSYQPYCPLWVHTRFMETFFDCQ